jgi:hypothetical protein
MRIKLYLSIVLVALFTASCGSEETTDSDSENGEKANTIENDESEVGSVEAPPTYGPLPSPLHIVMMFKSYGLEYQDGVTHDAKVAKDLVSSFKKKLNIGVYSADFAYAGLNNEDGEAKIYLQTIEELAADVGFGGIYNRKEDLERLENNIDNMDSIAQIISEIQIHANQYFTESGEQEKAFLVFAGAWIESMYLGAMSKDLNNDVEITEALLDQEVILNDLMASLRSIENSEEIEALLDDLRKIREMFDIIYANENEEGELVITRRQIDDMKELIIAIRTKIVNH